MGASTAAIARRTTRVLTRHGTVLHAPMVFPARNPMNTTGAIHCCNSIAVNAFRHSKHVHMYTTSCIFRCKAFLMTLIAPSLLVHGSAQIGYVGRILLGALTISDTELLYVCHVGQAKGILLRLQGAHRHAPTARTAQCLCF